MDSSIDIGRPLRVKLLVLDECDEVADLIKEKLARTYLFDLTLAAEDSIGMVEHLRLQGHTESLRLVAMNPAAEDASTSAAPISDSGENAGSFVNTMRQTVLQAGPLIMDLVDRTAMRGDRRISLLPKEFCLLEYLMRHSNQVVTRAMLLRDVWRYRFVPKTNLVDVHIGKLRRKIDGLGEPALLHSVRSAGYILKVSE